MESSNQILFFGIDDKRKGRGMEWMMMMILVSMTAQVHPPLLV
jgi:hypothetical protein